MRYRRLVEEQIREALADTPAVLIVGPRRAGKTTLLRDFAKDGWRYATLDDASTLQLAQADPTGFVRGLGSRAAIDEVQRAPDVLLAVKQAIDEDYHAGHFLLTGSANLLTLPRVADSLAGRMQTVELLPLTQTECQQHESSGFLDMMFAGQVPDLLAEQAIVGDALTKVVLAGGFPEVVQRPNERRQQAWARSYIQSVLLRDLRDIADVEKIAEMPRLVRLLSEFSGQVLNVAQLATSVGLSQKTCERYITLLEQVFFVARLRPWYSNNLKRLLKTPKLYFLDSCVLASSRGLTFKRLKRDRQLFGALLETFVYAEIRKLAAAAPVRPNLYYCRDQEQREVDLIIERDDNQLVAFEVKASATVGPKDFAPMAKFAAAHPERFTFGAVLYDSHRVIRFGDRLAAIPLSMLWYPV